MSHGTADWMMGFLQTTLSRATILYLKMKMFWQNILSFLYIQKGNIDELYHYGQEEPPYIM